MDHSVSRRSALQALALMASAGLVVKPVLTREADASELVIIRAEGPISQGTADRLRDCWKEGVEGTALEGVKAVVLGDGLDIEIVRGRGI